MSKKAFNKIAAGLNEAIAVARGKSKPTKVTRGRPKTTGPGEQVAVRLHPPLLTAVDAFIAEQDDAPSRPEAIRRMLERFLEFLKSHPRRS